MNVWKLTLVPLVAAAAGCIQPIRESSLETLRRAPGAGVEVRLDRGTVEVREHAGSDVEIGIERSANALSRDAAASALDALRVDAAAAASGRLVVRGRDLGAGAFRLGESTALQVTLAVPAGAPVSVRTGEGRVRLVGLTGAVNAWTAEGRIVAESVRAEAEPARLRTARGRIEGSDLTGRFHAETGDGRIQLSGALAQVHAVTGDGQVRVEVAPSARPAPEGVWELRSADGSIRLTLPAGWPARISAVGDEDEDEGRAIWLRRAVLRFASMGDRPGAEIRLRAGGGGEVSLTRSGPREEIQEAAVRP